MRSNSPTELLKQLRTIELRTSRLADEQLAGSYHSVFKGQGLSFREVRAYSPGDDVRFIDWNVSARMSEPFVKVFTEEREMTVMLVVDVSASGEWGTVRASKSHVATEVAALCAFSAIKNNDNVGLILGTEVVEKIVPPKKGDKHVMRVIREILGFTPAYLGTDLELTLQTLVKVCKRRSVAFVISDFFAEGYERALALAASLAPVRVNCISPGWIRTKWGAGASDQWQKRAVRESILRRWGEPADIAATVAWIVSADAAFVTGQVIPVNGGFRRA